MPWVSPFALPGSWFRGNLHTHTTQSDGLYSPEQAIAWYRQHGYDFIAISDHWVLTPGRSVGNDFLTITATELNGADYHMLALGLSSLPDRALTESPREIADAVRAAEGLAYFAHPYWMGQTSAQIGDSPSVVGIEVFNSVCEKMDGLGYSCSQWDELLAAGHRHTAIAVDDVHWKHSAEGQGYVMVRATELDEQSILRALALGSFYSSSGPTILDLRTVTLDDGRLGLRVHCSPCTEIIYYATRSLGYRFEAAEGATLDTAVYPLDAAQGYLRVECRDARGGIAWSNPVFLEDVLS